MTFFDLLNLFLVGSVIGWVLELFYRRFFSTKKWINPGFLSGPWVPLYGFGLVALFTVTTTLERIPMDVPVLKKGIEILLLGVTMTLLELVAGIIFIDGMKIKLWDYSDRPGNYKGIICPLFSLIWAAVGAGYLFLLHPLAERFLEMIGWSYGNIFASGLLLGVLLTDFGYSVNLSARIRNVAKEFHTVVPYEKLKQNFNAELKRLKKHRNFLFPLNSPVDFKDDIRKFLEERLHK